MNDQQVFLGWSEWKAEKKIGEGSYGKVYKAVKWEYGIPKYSAIKVISIPNKAAEIDSLRADGMTESACRIYYQGIVNEFVQEVKLLELLKGNTNIVSIEDFRVIEKIGQIGWDIYIRMELLTPFTAYADEHSMDEKKVIELGLDICSALKICASHQIIHRDIKPGNFFVSRDGKFKIGDFGIAKQLDKSGGTLSFKGTMHYIAPEVAKGNKYDARADIYSLGLVLYKLLNNNRLPFIPPYTEQITYEEQKRALDRRLQGDSLPRPVNATPEVAEVILKACSYDQRSRYQNAVAFEKALQELQEPGWAIEPNQKPNQKPNPKQGSEPDDQGWRKMIIIGTSVLLAAILLVLGIRVEKGLLDKFRERSTPELTLAPESSFDPEPNLSYSVFLIDPPLNQSYKEIPVVAASASSIIDQGDTNNDPLVLLDGREDTSWQEGVSGYGIGESLHFSFDGVHQVKYISFKLGNWKNDRYYYGNAKPKTITIYVGDFAGSVTFTGKKEVEWIELTTPVAANEVWFSIDDVYEGTEWEDTCITEMRIYE